MSLENYLKEKNISFYRTNVGDRYILSKMIETESRLGGEPSGHVLLTDFAKTGDGLLTALKILFLLKKSGLKASELLRPFKLVPQLLKNIKNINKNILLKNDVQRFINDKENLLGKGSRVLIRPSGTEDLIRVMVESPDLKKIEEVSDNICSFLINENKICKNE